MEEIDKLNNNKTNDEVDIIKLISEIWLKRKLIIKLTLAFTVLGICLITLTPNKYTASITLVPQTSEKKASSGLSGLAAMAGINLSSTSSGEILSPSIYPKIINNVNFQKELLYTKYKVIKSEKPISYFEYRTNSKFSSFNIINLITKYTIGLPSLLIEAIRNEPNPVFENSYELNEEIAVLTKKEQNIIKNLYKNLNLSLNNKEGYISISFTSEEPILSAEIVLSTQKLLQGYLTKFKIEKVKSNLEFIEKSYNEAKINFEKKQIELASFRDANKTLASEKAKTQEEKLISEYNLLLNIYSELAKQKEQAKIAITETTPILTIIEPVSIPVEKSGPNRTLILIGFIFLGFFIGISIIIVRLYYTKLIEENFR